MSIVKGRSTSRIHVHGQMATKPLSAQTWPDFVNLFGRHKGVWGGCWCMFYHKLGRFDSKDYENNKNEKSQLVRQDRSHGILVYCNSEPVGWCQFGPREELPRIDRKRGYQPTDQNAWRITCLFVARDHRARGVARKSVEAAIEEMRGLGVTIIEAYPVSGRVSASFLWSGTPELFEPFGFRLVVSLGKSSGVYALSL